MNYSGTVKQEAGMLWEKWMFYMVLLGAALLGLIFFATHQSPSPASGEAPVPPPQSHAPAR